MHFSTPTWFLIWISSLPSSDSLAASPYSYHSSCTKTKWDISWPFHCLSPTSWPINAAHAYSSQSLYPMGYDTIRTTEWAITLPLPFTTYHYHLQTLDRTCTVDNKTGYKGKLSVKHVAVHRLLKRSKNLSIKKLKTYFSQSFALWQITQNVGSVAKTDW